MCSNRIPQTTLFRKIGGRTQRALIPLPPHSLNPRSSFLPSPSVRWRLSLSLSLIEILFFEIKTLILQKPQFRHRFCLIWRLFTFCGFIPVRIQFQGFELRVKGSCWVVWEGEFFMADGRRCALKQQLGERFQGFLLLILVIFAYNLSSLSKYYL